MTASLGDLGVLPPGPHLPQKDRLPGKLAFELLGWDIDDRQPPIFDGRGVKGKVHVRWREQHEWSWAEEKRENKESIGLERGRANEH